MDLLSIIVVKLLEVLKKSKRLPLVNREQSAVLRRLVVVARRRWMYILYLLIVDYSMKAGTTKG